LALAIIIFYIKRHNAVRNNYALLGKEAFVIKKGGISFRDLNKNGKLDIYEDYRQPIEKRVMNLLDQMIVSKSLVDGKGIEYICNTIEIVKPEFIQTKRGKYKGAILCA
jgi:beta-glucosidase